MEYEAAQNGAAQAKKKICLEAEAASFAFDNEAREASGKKPQDEPHGDLVKRDMHSLSKEAVAMVYPARELLNFAKRRYCRKPGARGQCSPRFTPQVKGQNRQLVHRHAAFAPPCGAELAQRRRRTADAHLKIDILKILP